jgi:hypothetical protein
MGDANPRQLRSVDEFVVGGVRVRIETLAPEGAEDSRERLRQGFLRQASLEGRVLMSAQPPRPTPWRPCFGLPDDAR